MDWEAYVAGLSALERPRAEALAKEYGQDAANRRVRYHLVSSLNELENTLRRDSQRVRTQVLGLYESIDVNQPPTDWIIQNPDGLRREEDGTLVIHTDVTGPNGATGFFERGFNAADNRIELRQAFLQMDGMTYGLPTWVAGREIELVRGRGTPTHVYFTLYQLKLLGVPAGAMGLWYLPYRLGMRAGPFAEPGVATSIRMKTIWNLETILHLHWLRGRYPHIDLSVLIAHTASVRYAEDIAIQCGYRVVEASYVSADEWEVEVDGIMQEYESGNPERRQEHDRLLLPYSFARSSAMKQNFDIELSIVPAEME